MQQHHQPYVDRRRSELRNNNKKTAYDDFYTKLERIRLSAAAASSSSSKQNCHRTATELLDESKAFFVKSEEVLHNRQTLSTTSPLRISQSHCTSYQDELQLDHSLGSSSDYLFESVSVLSYSDQTTLDSTNSPLERKRPVIPSSSVTIIERNARIIKWLFQLHKTNESYPFQCS